MCGECNWDLDVDSVYHKKCDCGNSKWEKVEVQASEEEVMMQLPVNIVYRCTKCDSLQMISKSLFKIYDSEY